MTRHLTQDQTSSEQEKRMKLETDIETTNDLTEVMVNVCSDCGVIAHPDIPFGHSAARPDCDGDVFTTDVKHALFVQNEAS